MLKAAKPVLHVQPQQFTGIALSSFQTGRWFVLIKPFSNLPFDPHCLTIIPCIYPDCSAVLRVMHCGVYHCVSCAKYPSPVRVITHLFTSELLQKWFFKVHQWMAYMSSSLTVIISWNNVLYATVTMCRCITAYRRPPNYTILSFRKVRRKSNFELVELSVYIYIYIYIFIWSNIYV